MQQLAIHRAEVLQVLVRVLLVQVQLQLLDRGLACSLVGWNGGAAILGPSTICRCLSTGSTLSTSKDAGLLSGARCAPCLVACPAPVPRLEENTPCPDHAADGLCDAHQGRQEPQRHDPWSTERLVMWIRCLRGPCWSGHRKGCGQQNTSRVHGSSTGAGRIPDA